LFIELARTVQKALADTPLKNVIVTDIGDLFPRPKAFIINFVLKNIKKKIPDGTSRTTYHLEPY